MGNRIKNLALVLIAIAIIGCFICFFAGLGKYSKDKEYIEYATVYGGAYGYPRLQSAGDSAYLGKMLMTYGGLGIGASIIGGLPLYWFGCLFNCVEDTKQIAKNNERKLKTLIDTIGSNKYKKDKKADLYDDEDVDD